MGKHSVGPQRVEELLARYGAKTLRHGNSRSLYEHLIGTYAILRCWSQPDWVCNAGALHSVYGTEVYTHRLVSTAHRSDVQAAVGPQTERLVYLFSVVSRRDLVRKMRSERIPADGLKVECQVAGGAATETLNTDESVSLLVLHLANMSEQACSEGGLPGVYLSSLSSLALILSRVSLNVPPIFSRCSQAISIDSERAARESYLAGLSVIASDSRAAANWMSSAARECPWVAEPAVWLAYLDLQDDQPTSALLHVERAREILSQWGTPWDKRLNYDQWFWLLDFIARYAGQGEISVPTPGEISELRALLKLLVSPVGRYPAESSPHQEDHEYT